MTSVRAGMSERAILPFGPVELGDTFPFHLAVLLHHHLANAVAVVDGYIFLPEIYEDDPDFPPVIGIDCARSVEHGQSMLQAPRMSRRREARGRCG